MPIARNSKLVSNQRLHALLAAFEAGTSVTEAGLSYERLDFQQLFEILPDAFTVKPEVSRSEAIDLFSRALRDCRRASAMTAENLVARAEEIHKAELAKAPRPFTLWTKFRAANMAHSPGFALSWHGVRLRTRSYLPAWLRRSDYLLNGVGRFFPDRPHGFGHIILSCEDRDEDRAVDRMLDALQLVQGLTNMYESWGHYTFFGTRKWTEGKLWTGPNQYLFDGRKFRGEERIWFNPDYDEEAWKLNPAPMARILEVLPYVRKALAALDNHPFREVLVRAVLLLQDGMASRDGSHRLLRYWSALERLYVEPEDRTRSNGKVLDRAVFAEREPELARWKLEHIARLRNDHVHAGGGAGDLHEMGQFLRELVARHIGHWIFAGNELPDHQSLLDLMKLPSDPSALKRMRDLVDKRLSSVPDYKEGEVGMTIGRQS